MPPLFQRCVAWKRQAIPILRKPRTRQSARLNVKQNQSTAIRLKGTQSKSAGTDESDRRFCISANNYLAFSLLAAALPFLCSFGRLWDRQSDAARHRLQNLWLFPGCRQIVYQRAARPFREDQFMRVLVQVHMHEITQCYLCRGYKVRQRIDQKPLDGSFQVTGAVLEVQTFFQK